MRKYLIIIAMLLLVACGVTRYTNQRTIHNTDEISYILSLRYPQLYHYYNEGVLRVNSIREIMLPTGEIDYKVKYEYVKYYYRDQGRWVVILHDRFPDLYEMYVTGIIDVNYIYKYVETRTGNIRYKVSYRRVYDLYYYPQDDFYPRLYYRPRHRPTPPPPPRVEPPRPPISEPNHEGRPGYNPQRRPNTSPGGQGNSGGVRPNNQNRPPEAKPSNPQEHSRTQPRQQRGESSARQESSQRSSGSQSSSRSSSQSSRSGSQTRRK